MAEALRLGPEGVEEDYGQQTGVQEEEAEGPDQASFVLQKVVGEGRDVAGRWSDGRGMVEVCVMDFVGEGGSR